MHKLTWDDATGQQWSCRVELSDAKRLRENGTDVFNPNGIAKLFSEILETVEFLAELMRPQWEQRGLTAQAFEDLIVGGDGIYQSAADALNHALSDFFRRLGRPALAMVIERAWRTAMEMETQSLTNAGGAKVTALMESMLVKAQREFDAAVETQIAKLQKPGV